MSDRVARARAIFWEALEKESPQERARLVEHACGSDAALRDEVMGLLRAHAEAGSFMGGASGAGEGLVGASIGPYRLLERIGEGGFGVVYAAEQTEPVRRRVALKVVKEGMDTREVLARFAAERQALALMDHPCIARVFDGGATDGGRPYFVMELVKGIPIHEYCDRCQLTLRERLELFVQVCQAVQHAHQKGVIHRDLKPSNVLVAVQDGGPVPKVIDFGIAKATGSKLTEETFHTRFAAMVGTPQYMSPEQAEMSRLDVDTRSDIYSLGVLLYELLTGTTPLTRERLERVTFDELRRIIREEEPPTPSARLTTLNGEGGRVALDRRTDRRRLLQAVHGDLDWIAMKALDKDRTRRYETASAFAADIGRHLRDEPVEARPASAWYRLGKLVRRNRGRVVAAALVLVALVVGVVGTTIGLVRALDAERMARSERDEKDRARAEAEEQASIAKAVADFLRNDIFGQAGYRRWSGEDHDPDVKVRALLDRAAGTIGERFGGQPLTEAAIRHAIGVAYLSLGAYAEARQHLERSVELRTAKSGAGHSDTLDSLLMLADVHFEAGDYDRAESLAEQVLLADEATYGPADPWTRGSKSLLALIYESQGRYDRAEPLLREQLETERSTLGPNDPETLSATANLGELYLNQARYDAAEPLLTEALQGRERVLGQDHLDTLSSRGLLALLYKKQGRYDLAEPLYRVTLEAREARQGPEHPATLRARHNLAVLYVAQSDYTRAEPLMRAILDARTAKLGPDSWDTLSSRKSLAFVYAQQGRYADAEPLYLAVLNSPTTRQSPDHPKTLHTKKDLAQLYARQGKHDLAEPLYREALEGFTAVLGADHDDTLATEHNLAKLYVAQGHLDKAEPLLREAVEGARRTLSLRHPTTQAMVASLLGCYERMGRPGLAEPLCRELAEFWRGESGEDSPRYAAQLAVLGLNLLEQGKHAGAETVLRECVAIRQAKEPDAWSTFDAMSALGASVAGQGRHAEAERLLVEGYDGMKRRESIIPEDARTPCLTGALKRLVRLYEQWGKEQEAAAWRAELERAGRPR